MVAVVLSVIAVIVSSNVDSVIVYPNQVLVVRTARVTVSGAGELVLTGLPGALDDNTVRISAPGLVVGEVQVRKGYLAEPTPAVKKLEQKVKDLEDQLKKLKDEEDIVKAKVEFLKSIKLGTPELIAKELQQGRISAQSWREALSFMAEEMAKAMARQVGLGREQEEVQKQLNAARQEYNDARAAVENRKEVRFDYEAVPGTYGIRLSYAVSYGASWVPYYELRARPDQDKVGLAYFCKLSQKTGEDWDQVRVVLSTSRPEFGIIAPEPEPWYLSLVEVRRLGAETGMMAETMLAPGAAMKAEAQERSYDEVAAVGTGISLQYVIPGRVSLKSGEAPKKLLLREAGLTADYGYYCLPRTRPQAFLQGRIVNTTPFVFLAGEASTYVGDEYTGSSYLSPIAPGETTEVSFGVDERVKVTRELVKSFKSRGGLFAKTEKAQFSYKTMVENYLPKTIKIELVEQVPVSQQSEVKVNVTKVEPKFLAQNADKGTYTWKPELESKGRFVVDLEFTVEYPAGRRVQGLY
ncbi:MAG: mucoidy inhibitor MuiA family protein [candidate division WOR-3 bacterium]